VRIATQHAQLKDFANVPKQEKKKTPIEIFREEFKELYSGVRQG
jgi:hypothetical protein